jgi:hypothetical protein
MLILIKGRVCSRKRDKRKDSIPENSVSLSHIKTWHCILLSELSGQKVIELLKDVPFFPQLNRKIVIAGQKEVDYIKELLSLRGKE